MIQPDNLTKTMCVVIATITAPAELLGFLYFTIFNFKRKKGRGATAAPIFPRYTPVVFWSQYAAFLARQGAFPPASFRSGEFGIRRCFNWLCVDGHLTRDNEISSFSPLYYRHFCAVWFCRSQDTRSSDENIFLQSQPPHFLLKHQTSIPFFHFLKTCSPEQVGATKPKDTSLQYICSNTYIQETPVAICSQYAEALVRRVASPPSVSGPTRWEFWLVVTLVRVGRKQGEQARSGIS